MITSDRRTNEPLISYVCTCTSMCRSHDVPTTLGWLTDCLMQWLLRLPPPSLFSFCPYPRTTLTWSTGVRSSVSGSTLTRCSQARRPCPSSPRPHASLWPSTSCERRWRGWYDCDSVGTAPLSLTDTDLGPWCQPAQCGGGEGTRAREQFWVDLDDTTGKQGWKISSHSYPWNLPRDNRCVYTCQTRRAKVTMVTSNAK